MAKCDYLNELDRYCALVRARLEEADEDIKDFDRFEKVMRSRLEMGRVEYGNSSFEKSLEEVHEMNKEECVDSGAYGYIRWRISDRAQKDVAKQLEAVCRAYLRAKVHASKNKHRKEMARLVGVDL